MRKKEEYLEREMAEVSLQNKRLAEPLQRAREEMIEMQKRLANHERDKQILACTKARLKVTEKELKDLKWEHEILEQRFIKVQQEREELYRKFTAAIQEVQQKTGFKNLVLERKLQALNSAVEKREVQFNEVLAASNLDPTALTLVSRKLEVGAHGLLSKCWSGFPGWVLQSCAPLRLLGWYRDPQLSRGLPWFLQQRAGHGLSRLLLVLSLPTLTCLPV